MHNCNNNIVFMKRIVSLILVFCCLISIFCFDTAAKAPTTMTCLDCGSSDDDWVLYDTFRTPYTFTSEFEPDRSKSCNHNKLFTQIQYEFKVYKKKNANNNIVLDVIGDGVIDRESQMIDVTLFDKKVTTHISSSVVEKTVSEKLSGTLSMEAGIEYGIFSATVTPSIESSIENTMKTIYGSVYSDEITHVSVLSTSNKVPTNCVGGYYSYIYEIHGYQTRVCLSAVYTKTVKLQKKANADIKASEKFDYFWLNLGKTEKDSDYIFNPKEWEWVDAGAVKKVTYFEIVFDGFIPDTKKGRETLRFFKSKSDYKNYLLKNGVETIKEYANNYYK